MADFTITIANRVNTFGPAPSDKWNAYNWNAFVWGEGTADLAVAVGKVIGNTLALTDSTAKSTVHLIANTLAPTADMGSESLTDAAGYAYVFPDRVTEAENRAFPSWSSATASATTWATALAASTTWS